MTWAFAVDSVPFTKAVIAGTTSLGGSESACLGLARALVARGHVVHIFTSKIDDDARGLDPFGVLWHHVDDFQPMNEFIEWDVVVALRWYAFFGHAPVQARYKILWNQDLLVPGAMQMGVMSVAWAFDEIAYVSQYHRDQWEDLQPELAPVGWATRNGIDLSQVPTHVARDPNRIIHISRPERGLAPLLKLWPQLRALHPEATLRLCRYSSMYDAGGWGQVCRAYDREVEQVNAAVGGITYLGELNKVDLYNEISAAAVMWYPGVAGFAETNCIAAMEANACGTPFVGSLKGALVETAKPSFEAGLLIAGNAETDDAYAAASIAAVRTLLDGCARTTFAYRALQRQGRLLAQTCDYSVLAAEWEAHVGEAFDRRVQTQSAGVLRQLVHEDDYSAARVLAQTAGDAALASLADDVIHGRCVTADEYATDAIQDPLKEADLCTRFQHVAPLFVGRTRLIDVACGNGAFAIVMARTDPAIRIVGIDYSAKNIAAAKAAAERAGVADRCTFQQCTVYDFETHAMHRDWTAMAADADPFDALFVGEFVEHVAHSKLLIDSLETVLAPSAQVVYTCPAGAFDELRGREGSHKLTHVHRFHHDDVKAVFGQKRDLRADYLTVGWSARGNPIGNWMIRYTATPGRVASDRQIAARIRTTRPMPRLSVGIIARDAENDLGRCLASIWPIADEIVVGDTGSTDGTVAIAESYGARILHLAPVSEQPQGFAGARNAVLQACTGDWFLWIDADEVLAGSAALRRYLDGGIFNGFVLHQNHLQLDAPAHHDLPIRVFRRVPQIQFYGCVHEQPQWGDANTDIHPTLDVLDVQIAHTGYLTEAVRRNKMINRNMALIVKDATVFPERLLGKVILLRESVLQATRSREQHGGGITDQAYRGYLFALRVFREHFADPGHKFHGIARPWYEQALKALEIGWEVEIALAGHKGGMEHRHAKAERVWVADADEFSAIMAHRTTGITAKMQPPQFHTDPFVLPQAQPEAVSA